MEEFGIAEGDLGITKITTKTDLFGFNNMGTSNNYHFDNQINSCIFV